MASAIQQSTVSRDAAVHSPQAFEGGSDARMSKGGASIVTALSVEFVAKPQEAHRVQSAIPTAVAGALEGVAGFAGCLVMISEQEARLVTVITLWVGSDRRKRCCENARWVQKLLTPYVDRYLRVQTLAAHSPGTVLDGLKLNLEDEYSTGYCNSTNGETACVV